jgi:hypothetical protein
MSSLGRRAVLRALGMTPVAANALAKQATMASAGMTAGFMPPGPPSQLASNESGAVRFHNWADWFRRMEPSIRQEARTVTVLDPDIAEFRLPLATKVRMQRQRNYERIVAERRNYIESKLSLAGFIDWWP